MTTKINNKVGNDKCFSFGEAFYKIGLILDKKLAGFNNQVIRDLAGMDAIISVQNVLSGNVITSFNPIIGIEENE
jgi:hypothetical protein